MQQLQTILCPVDFSPLSPRAVRTAFELCKRSGARLLLHHNEPRYPRGIQPGSWIRKAEDPEDDGVVEIRRRLDELAEAIPASIEREMVISHGPLEPTLLYMARETAIDLIVMGTHGKSDVQHQSMTERIIIQAACPVLTVGEGSDPDEMFVPPHGSRPQEMRVLIPVDFSNRARAAVSYADRMAESMPHHLHLLHVMQPGGGAGLESSRPQVRAIEDRMLKMITLTSPDRISASVTVGKPSQEILRVANSKGVLFILMASHAKGPLQRYLFGTTTLDVLHGGPTPVLFVPEQIPGETRNEDELPEL